MKGKNGEFFFKHETLFSDVAGLEARLCSFFIFLRDYFSKNQTIWQETERSR